jgi:histidinol-phosphate/aromatic aminotransferase/cobyric acid decarboxylase-like protein
VGYVLAEPALVARLREVQPHWPVSAPALEACVACCAPDALEEAAHWAAELAARRSTLRGLVGDVAGVEPAASFLLIRTERPRIWEPLRDKGFAVRRGDTFPGLDAHWIRVAVRDDATSVAFAHALKECW